jgi:prepilin-type N-terminal cleavage/methylation domain-containing protein
VSRARLGFTLVELAIVLVVIGLVVAGIFVGRDLMWQASLRRAGSTANEIIVKVRLFKDRYGQYPGDTDQAWTLWGTSCADIQGNCNGDADYLIVSNYYKGTHGLSSSYIEEQCVFRHLALASLWDGDTSASACSTSGVTSTTIASNPEIVPKAIGDMYYHVGSWEMYERTGNTVNITKPSSNFAGAYMIGGGLTVGDAVSIDTKFDDGKPSSGQVYAVYAGPGGGCLAGGVTWMVAASAVSWLSDLTDTRTACNVTFWID